MLRRTVAVLATTVGLTGLGLGGCSQPAVLDVDRAESAIGERLAETYGVEVDGVACPAEVEVADGGDFRCRALVGEDTVVVQVTQTDADGTLEVVATRAILDTAVVEADIAATLADRFERDDVAVTCAGPDVRVEEPDATFSCEAVDGDETEEVTVLVRDVRGALTYTLEG